MLVNSLKNIITSISGEMVTNYVKVKIMNKAKEVDLASFDMPDFYERLENANREAGAPVRSPLWKAPSAWSAVSSPLSAILSSFAG